MSASFSKAFDILMRHEGRYSNNKLDKGGATNFGITQKDLNNLSEESNFPKFVKDLTLENARIYYKKFWWDKYNYESIKSDYIASKIFDMAVHMGAIEAHKLVQRAINRCGIKINVDGVLGLKSTNAINDIINQNHENDLKHEIQEEQSWFYEKLVNDNPTLKVFLKDWLSRSAY